MKNQLKNTDEYILLFPIEVQERLSELRAAEGIRNFEKDFRKRKYKFSKGAVQFPHFRGTYARPGQHDDTVQNQRN